MEIYVWYLVSSFDFYTCALEKRHCYVRCSTTLWVFDNWYLLPNNQALYYHQLQLLSKPPDYLLIQQLAPCCCYFCAHWNWQAPLGLEYLKYCNWLRLHGRQCKGPKMRNVGRLIQRPCTVFTNTTFCDSIVAPILSEVSSSTSLLIPRYPVTSDPIGRNTFVFLNNI